MICLTCLCNLDHLYDFRKKSYESEIYLTDLSRLKVQFPDHSEFSNISLDMESNGEHTGTALDSQHHQHLLENIVIENVLVNQSQVFDEQDFNNHLDTLSQQSSELNFVTEKIQESHETMELVFRGAADADGHHHHHQSQLQDHQEEVLTQKDDNMFLGFDFGTVIHSEVHDNVQQAAQIVDEIFDQCEQAAAKSTEHVERKKDVGELKVISIFDKHYEELVDGRVKRRAPKGKQKVCIVCEKYFKSNYKLAEHMRSHSTIKPYKCEHCTKAFKSKVGLVEHESKHTGHFSFTCETCNKGFNNRSYLALHQRVHNADKTFKCSTCGACVKSKKALVDHVNRHLGVKPFLCESCDLRFTTKSSLEIHEMTHKEGTARRDFGCTVCPKRFTAKAYLKIHQRIHDGDRHFLCAICDKGFVTAIDLKMHEKQHTGEKNYVCETCGKSFRRQNTLTIHARVHSGMKPYRFVVF